MALGGTITLAGANGTALNADVYLRGGTVVLTNATGANNNNRLGDSRSVFLDGGGTLILQGMNSGDSTETITARLDGFGRLIVTNGSGSATAKLTVNADRANRGVLAFQADQGNSKLLFSTAPTLFGGGGGAGGDEGCYRER